jgi:uncharacterized membrane protein YheB (UPF0754 family)
MKLSKSKITDIVSLILIIISFYIPNEEFSRVALYTGLFAISGAITNQLAIYMLFNRVPLLYGSGVIEKNFKPFKKSIKNMIMTQFFTKEQLTKFFQENKKQIDLAPLVNSADFKPAFTALKQSVMESKLGDALSLFGGEKALEPLERPFSDKLKSAVVNIVSSDTFKKQIDQHLKSSSFSDDLIISIDTLVTKRLDDLTPKMVNNLVYELIHTHLGWLVVWGGVFGGLIGLISSTLL